jgi:hypothetical protein
VIPKLNETTSTDAGASTPHQASQRVEQGKTAGQASKLLFEFYLDICCAKH